MVFLQNGLKFGSFAVSTTAFNNNQGVNLIVRHELSNHAFHLCENQ